MLSFSKSICTLNSSYKIIAISAAVLSDPPLSYVVSSPSTVFPINPPIDITSFSSSNLRKCFLCSLDSSNMKLAASKLSSVMIGHFSISTWSHFNPLLLIT